MINNLSKEQKDILTLATENLIQAILSMKLDNNMENLPINNQLNIRFMSKPSFSNKIIKFVQLNEKHKSSQRIFNIGRCQSDKLNYLHKNCESNLPSVFKYIPNQLRSPKCVTIQPSFSIGPRCPQVPIETTIITAKQADKLSSNHINKIPEYFITTNEEFENILSKEKRQSQHELVLKVNTLVKSLLGTIVILLAKFDYL